MTKKVEKKVACMALPVVKTNFGSYTKSQQTGVGTFLKTNVIDYVGSFTTEQLSVVTNKAKKLLGKNTFSLKRVMYSDITNPKVGYEAYTASYNAKRFYRTNFAFQNVVIVTVEGNDYDEIIKNWEKGGNTPYVIEISQSNKCNTFCVADSDRVIPTDSELNSKGRSALSTFIKNDLFSIPAELGTLYPNLGDSATQQQYFGHTTRGTVTENILVHESGQEYKEINFNASVDHMLKFREANNLTVKTEERVAPYEKTELSHHKNIVWGNTSYNNSNRVVPESWINSEFKQISKFFADNPDIFREYVEVDPDLTICPKCGRPINRNIISPVHYDIMNEEDYDYDETWRTGYTIENKLYCEHCDFEYSFEDTIKTIIKESDLSEFDSARFIYYLSSKYNLERDYIDVVSELNNFKTDCEFNSSVKTVPKASNK